MDAVTPNLAVNPAGAILAGWTTSPHETVASAGPVAGGFSAPVTLGPARSYKRAGVHLTLAANGAGRRAVDRGNGVQAATGSLVVTYAGNAATSPPGQGFGAPVHLAPSSSVMQLAAAAGHALAIWVIGGNLTAATEPVT